MTRSPEIAADGKEHAEFASDIPKYQCVKTLRVVINYSKDLIT